MSKSPAHAPLFSLVIAPDTEYRARNVTWMTPEQADP